MRNSKPTICQRLMTAGLKSSRSPPATIIPVREARIPKRFLNAVEEGGNRGMLKPGGQPHGSDCWVACTAKRVPPFLRFQASAMSRACADTCPPPKTPSWHHSLTVIGLTYVG